MKTCIFLDIDGTLLSYPNTTILPETVRDLKQAQENGLLLFLNTGRSYSELPVYLKDFGFDGFISGCGSSVIYQQKEIFYQYFNDLQMKQLMDVIQNQKCYYTLEGQYDTYCDIDLIPEYKGICKRIDNKPLGLHPIKKEELYHCKDIVKLTLFCYSSLDLFKPLYKDYDIVSASEGYAEVLIKGCSKANGIEIIKKYFNDDVYTIAFGDGFNDIEMLSVCDDSYAMGNAVDGVKEKAKHVCLSVDDNGVGEQLRKLGYIK